MTIKIEVSETRNGVKVQEMIEFGIDHYALAKDKSNLLLNYVDRLLKKVDSANYAPQRTNPNKY